MLDVHKMTHRDFYTDEIAPLHGRALDMLYQMANRSVNCCVTSPPYTADSTR